MNYPFDQIEITLVDAVPGCGKTHDIIAKHQRGVDLVTCTSKAGQREYIQRIPNLSSEERKFYRTIDSALMHDVPEVDTMYADEALMSHCGTILLVAMKCKAKRVFMFGDTNQIHFIGRVTNFQVCRDTIDCKVTKMHMTCPCTLR